MTNNNIVLTIVAFKAIKITLKTAAVPPKATISSVLEHQVTKACLFEKTTRAGLGLGLSFIIYGKHALALLLLPPMHKLSPKWHISCSLAVLLHLCKTVG